MKKLLSVIMLMLCLPAALRAQMILDQSHAMLHVDVTDHYLLLPVQEREDIANVSVVVDNHQVQKLNVRLAVDKVDYFVPLDLKRFGAERVLLDIVFNGDRRTTGAIKGFACWKEMRQSNTFDTTNREAFRPAYHHTPLYGWMNDPNGMVYKDGVWHLYFQYNPYGSQWENMTWGHSTSTDLVHWQQQPNALEPDALGAIFSGSCVVDKDNTAGFGKDAIIAMYTSADRHQTQSLAYSTDGGQTFTKYSDNPVITYNTPDFRDPKVFWHEPTGRWIVVLAAGQEVQFYSSPNLKDWTYESSFGHGYGNHDGVWECPDLFLIDNSQFPILNSQFSSFVLLVNINPGGPYGGSATQYFTGSFDGHEFRCDSKPETTKWMDYGKDHYATVTFSNAPDGRHVALAWMSNWQYANQVPTRQFRSANSIARDLSLFRDGDETYLACRPAKEMDAIRGRKLSHLTETCEIVVELNGSAQLTLSNKKGETVVLSYDEAARTFTMDRTQSTFNAFSESFAAKTVAPTHGAIRQLRLFVDRCSLEAFDAEGKMVMTNLIFPTTPYTELKVKGAKANIYEVKDER